MITQRTTNSARIVVDEHPDPKDRESIFKRLVKYNDTKVEAPDLTSAAILLRDPGDDGVIGGLWAQCVYDWLFVELLFVPETLHGSGLGSALMREAEAVAVKRDCIGIWLDTYSFQARGFYEKLGYEIFGRLGNFPKGETRYFLRKNLISADP